MHINHDHSVIHTLEHHKMRKTPVRISVLNFFKLKGHSLSQPEIEEKFRSEFDRVTIYRTLHAFIEIGIIHKVPSEDGVTRYGLCLHTHSHEVEHRHEHIHFVCQACSKTLCIDTDVKPILNLPAGFEVNEVSLFVKGTCSECSSLK